VRGQGGGGGRFGFPGGLGFPSGGRSQGGGIGVPAGGGLAGILVIIVIIGIFFFLNGGLSGGSGNTGLQPGPLSTNLASCQTGADANAREDCRIVGYVNSVNAYWQEEYPKLTNQPYTVAQTTLFSNTYNTGCGQASTQTGPFYCPADKNVYLDLAFFDVLTSELGGTAAPLAQAYVIAHEYGHHAQDLLGVLDRMNDGDTGPTSNGVRIELQADCYAGVWAAHAVDTGYIEPLSQTDVNDALQEAKAVGDDWIQQHTGGGVNPDSWTHGSSEQRVRWFTNGYRGGDPSYCDTFSTNQL
jgi:predicted metalloprotease